MFRAISSMLTAAVLAATTAIVQAAALPMVSNDTTGQVIFADDFESGTVGSSPGTNDPSVGTWSTGEWGATGTSGIHVICNQSSAGFAANEGSQFVKLQRADPGNNPWIRGDGVAANSGEGDTIRLQLAYRVDSGLITLLPVRGTGFHFIGEMAFWADGSIGVLSAGGS